MFRVLGLHLWSSMLLAENDEVSGVSLNVGTFIYNH
jgi:hypothetical protein